MSQWQMQDAKARFAELIRKATDEGPQVVTHRGVETAVVLSMKDFRRLDGTHPSFADYLLSGPRLDDDAIAAINDRSKDAGRDVEF